MLGIRPRLARYPGEQGDDYALSPKRLLPSGRNETPHALPVRTRIACVISDEADGAIAFADVCLSTGRVVEAGLLREPTQSQLGEAA